MKKAKSHERFAELRSSFPSELSAAPFIFRWREEFRAAAFPGSSGFRSSRRSGRMRFSLFRRGPACDTREQACNGDWKFAETVRLLFLILLAPWAVPPAGCKLCLEVRGHVSRAERFPSPGEET